MLTLAAAASLATSFAALAADTYKVEHWPADIDRIPCRAWTHSPDGSWALGGYVQVGASVLENVGFGKGDASARLLDQKCGKK